MNPEELYGERPVLEKWQPLEQCWGFPCGTVIKNSPANTGDTGDMGLIPGLGRSPEGEMATCQSPAPAARDSTWRDGRCQQENEAASQFSWTAYLFQV